MKRTLWMAAALLFAFASSRAEAPSAPAEPARRLSLKDAVQLAVQGNLAVKLAEARSESARGEALVAAARLLPNFYASAYQNRVFKENLKALGFNFPAGGPFSTVIGPFNTFDARINMVLTVLDLSAIRRSQSTSLRRELSRLEEDLARDQVAAAAALGYIEALRTGNSVDAAQADLDLALALQKLARDQHKAGVSTGIDVARAETRAAEATLRLERAQAAMREARLRLERVAGLPLGRPLELTDALRAGADAAPPGLEESVRSAASDRLELKVADGRLRADDLALKSAQDQRLPAVTASANYGLSGNLPDGGAIATSGIGASVSVPLWAGGSTKGQIRQADAGRARSEAQLADMRGQVEEDVRLSVDELQTGAEEVKTADLTVKLAERELQLARDRFASGVGDNVEVVNGQDALARARDAQLAALSQYQAARINLALALGRMGAFKL